MNFGGSHKLVNIQFLINCYNLAKSSSIAFLIGSSPEEPVPDDEIDCNNRNIQESLY